ncbi:MAG: VCBS repeat-containing protein [Planctomycetaceae bacterium]
MAFWDWWKSIERRRRGQWRCAEGLEDRVLLSGDFAGHLGSVVVPATPVDLQEPFGGIWLDDHFELFGRHNLAPALQRFDAQAGVSSPVEFFTKLNPDGNQTGYQGGVYAATILDSGALVYVGESDGYFYSSEYLGWFKNSTYWTDINTPHQVIPAHQYGDPIWEVSTGGTWLTIHAYGQLGEGTFDLFPGVNSYFEADIGANNHFHGGHISSDGEYISGGGLLKRDEFGFFDNVDLSGFDFSVQQGNAPNFHDIQVGPDGQHYFAASYFDLNTFESRIGFWNVDGEYLGTVGEGASTFRGFAVVEGMLVAAVNVAAPDTGEFEGYLVSMPDLQAVSVESLIGQPGYFAGEGTGEDIFSTDDRLGMHLANQNGSFVVGIRTFDTAQSFEDSVFQFDNATGRWTIGHSVNGMFTQERGPRWSTAVTWETMTGDVNGDRMTDLIGRQLESGQWWVAVAQSDGSFLTRPWGGWDPAYTYVDVTVGDFNNDGSDDIAGRRSTGEWMVGLSNNSRFVTRYAGRWAETGWQQVLTGDFNGDGRQDFAGLYASGHWWFSLFDGSKFRMNYAGRWSESGWQDIVAGDFDGDGLTDIAGIHETGAWWQGTSTGTSIQTAYKGRWTNSADDQQYLVGDFDGDGRDDIAGLSVDNLWYVNAVRDVDNHRFPKVQWGDWNFASGWQANVGDVNRDGFADIVGYLPTTKEWYVLISQSNVFDNQLYATWN